MDWSKFNELATRLTSLGYRLVARDSGPGGCQLLDPGQFAYDSWWPPYPRVEEDLHVYLREDPARPLSVEGYDATPQVGPKAWGTAVGWPEPWGPIDGDEAIAASFLDTIREEIASDDALSKLPLRAIGKTWATRGALIRIEDGLGRVVQALRVVAVVVEAAYAFGVKLQTFEGFEAWARRAAEDFREASLASARACGVPVTNPE
jgi:hypothetical protein